MNQFEAARLQEGNVIFYVNQQFGVSEKTVTLRGGHCNPEDHQDQFISKSYLLSGLSIGNFYQLKEEAIDTACRMEHSDL